MESKSKEVDKRIKPELIMAEINYGYSVITPSGIKRHKPARFSLQESIMPTKFGRAEVSFKFDAEIFQKSNKNNSTIKNRMLQFENALTEIANHHITAKTIPTPKELNLSLSNKLRIETVQAPKIDILTYLYGKIEKENANSGKSMKNSKRDNTIKTYITVSHLIENYQLATGEKLLFDALDEVKYWKFWDVLDEILKGNIEVNNPNQPKKQRKQSYGYLVTSIRKYQKALLATLKEAVKDGNKMPLDVHDANLILKEVEATKDFYIEIEELKTIISTDVSFDSKLQYAKDYVIIACLTGMRYESMFDAQNAKIEICKDEKYNFNYIHSIHNKTSTEVFVPLLKPVQNIVFGDNGFPKITDNGTINRCLKLFFEHLGLNRLEKINKVTYRNGKITSAEPISNLITTHDCKGTFYSNLYSLNVPETVIDSITHPDRKPKNAMAKIYNKTTMLTKAKLFVDEIIKINSDVYTF